MAELLSIKQGSLSSIESGKHPVSALLLYKLQDKFRVNRNWIETGKGDMFLGEDADVLSLPEADAGVPYYNIDLSETVVNDLSTMDKDPEYYVNFPPFNDCTAYLPVFGDSMVPKYASGELIAVKEIPNKDIIQWGEAYLVITDRRANNMRTVKLLFEHEDGKKIILRSSNPDFKGDMVIDRKSIRSLYIVKGKIARNLL